MAEYSAKVVKIWRCYEFAAAHRLTRLPKEHKCFNLHGHNWKVEICLKGEMDAFLCWLADYAVIDAAWSVLFKQLDHGCLNDIEGLEAMPTCEALSVWIWDRLAVMGVISDYLAEVRVSENARSWCSYCGPGDPSK